jgi:AcrR family transcriptional regulator
MVAGANDRPLPPPIRRFSQPGNDKMDELNRQRAVPRKAASKKRAELKEPAAGSKRVKAPPMAHPLPDAPLTRGARSRLATRTKLIEAAHALMAEKGFDSSTIEEITRRADVGFGTFYNHFESKEDIATAVFAQRASEIRVVTDEISAAEQDRSVAVTYIQKMFLTKAVLDPVWARFIVRVQDSHRQMNETFVASAANDIRIALEQKRFSVTCIDTAADITIAALISAMRRILEGGPSEQITIETVECLMVLYGVEMTEARRLARLPLPDYISKHF